MEQYIPKSALVAEIERKLKELSKRKHREQLQSDIVEQMVYNEMLFFIDTLEVKEVDLEKEIKDYFNNQPIITRSKGVDYQLIPSNEDIAKHFFELGMQVSNKAQKGE
jgi:hypothetical protein